MSKELNLSPSIEVSEVSKLYRIARSSLFSKPSIRDPRPAVNNVSLKINNGERVGIIGHNGAGKSTLLHMIASLSNPSTGQIKVNGKVTSIMTLGIGLREDLTGKENIYVDGEIQGKTRSEINLVLDEIMAFAELDEFIDYPVRTYSTGMKSRLAFSMITCLSPEILIIDEALSAGDAVFAAKAAKKIREICDTGKIVILVSHSMKTINEMCTRCIWMNKGQLIADGKPEQITEKYLDSVRRENEHILMSKFKNLMINRAVTSDTEISNFEICYQGNSEPRQIIDSGKDLLFQGVIKLNKYSQNKLKLKLQIIRLDGLKMFEQLSQELHPSSEFKFELQLDQFCLGQGIYQSILQVLSFTSSDRNLSDTVLAERSTIFEVTCANPSVGGRPALIYPSVIDFVSL